jgi:predicted RND superfamily exporter protein
VNQALEGEMFKTNEGTLDRIVRVIAGIVILALFFVYPDAAWRWWALIGLVPLITGLVGTCPIYSIFGISTCPTKKA